MERQNKILAVYCVLSLPKTIHIQNHKPIYLEIFRPGPVTYCRPEPPCVVTDIPKRDYNQINSPCLICKVILWLELLPAKLDHFNVITRNDVYETLCP